MIVCYVKIIKLHSDCAALHLRTSHTKPGQHQAGWHCRTAHQFLYRPNTKEQKSMKLSMCFDNLQHVIHLNKKEIYIMYD